MFERDDAVWPGSIGWLIFWRSLPTLSALARGNPRAADKSAVRFLRERYIYFTARVNWLRRIRKGNPLPKALSF